jgi:hypothetical protein
MMFTGRKQGSNRPEAVLLDGDRRLAAQVTGSLLAHEVSVVMALNADVVDQAIYVANYPCRVVAVREVHATAGTDASAVTLDIKKCTGTQAPSAGTTVLGATVNLKGTANTVQAPAVVETAVATLAVGDRLAVDITGTTTAVAGVALTVSLQRV